MINLNEVNLDNCSISDEAVNILMTAGNFKGLTNLILSRNFEIKELAIFSQSEKNSENTKINNNLKKLNVKFCSLT